MAKTKKQTAKPVPEATAPGQNTATRPEIVPAGTETKTQDPERSTAGGQPVSQQPINTAEVDPTNKSAGNAPERDIVAESKNEDDDVPKYIRQEAKEAFKKVAADRLWFTGDGLGFDNEQNARQHAATIDNKKVYTVNK
jgi:hypothetical protein